MVGTASLLASASSFYRGKMSDPLLDLSQNALQTRTERKDLENFAQIKAQRIRILSLQNLSLETL